MRERTGVVVRSTKAWASRPGSILFNPGLRGNLGILTIDPINGVKIRVLLSVPVAVHMHHCTRAFQGSGSPCNEYLSFGSGCLEFGEADPTLTLS